MVKFWYSFAIPYVCQGESNLHTLVFLPAITINVSYHLNIKTASLVTVDYDPECPFLKNDTVSDDLRIFVREFENALSRAGYIELYCYPNFIKEIGAYNLITQGYQTFDVDILYKDLQTPLIGQSNRRNIRIPKKKA